MVQQKDQQALPNAKAVVAVAVVAVDSTQNNITYTIDKPRLVMCYQRQQNLASPGKKKVAAAAKGLDLPVLDLLPAYAGIDARRLAAEAFTNPHPNELAHRIAAQELSGYILENKQTLANSVGSSSLVSDRPAVRFSTVRYAWSAKTAPTATLANQAKSFLPAQTS